MSKDIEQCEICHTIKRGCKRAVIDGAYHKNVCLRCLSGGVLTPRDAKFNRERAQEHHSKEILQPYDRNGNINSDFVYAYPDTAEEMFTEEQLSNF